MAITTLSVVNDCLGLLGELPISDLDAFHPMVPRALSSLANQNTAVQASQWYFNTELITLVPQAGTKEIVLPGDTLSVDSRKATPNVTMRAGLLYNLDDGTTKFDAEVKARLHREVPFDNLPALPKVYIAACAKLDFQATIDGDPLRTRLLVDQKEQAYRALNAEHIRMGQVNMLTRPQVALALGRIVGQRNILRGY